MNHLAGRGAAIENARIAFFEDHHAAAFDALVARVDGSGHEVRESDVGDEAAALLHLQYGFFAGFPFGDAQLTVEHAGVHTDVRDRLGQAESAAPRLAILTRLRRSREFHVTILLFWSAAFVNRSERKTTS